MPRHTIETFKVKANLIFDDKYDYSHVILKTTKDKIDIICPEHGQFTIRTDQHLLGGGCQKCIIINDENTIKKFIVLANKIHNNRYDYSELGKKGLSKPSIIKCKEHGKFLVIPNLHIKLRIGCPKCSNKDYVDKYKSRKLNTVNYIAKANQKHNNKYDYSLVEYFNSTTDIKIKCKTHGVFKQNANKHLLGDGCPKCRYDTISLKLSLGQEEYITRIKEIHKDKYDYSYIKYINYASKVLLICPKHGKFTKRAENLLLGQGCQKCAQSGFSYKANEWLRNLNIEGLQTTESLGGEKKIAGLKVDGYDKETKTVYEYHGDFWHGNPKFYNPEKLHPISKKSSAF